MQRKVVTFDKKKGFREKMKQNTSQLELEGQVKTRP